MVKAIQPSCMVERDEDADAPECDLGVIQVEPTCAADPDDFDFDYDVIEDDDEDDDAEFDEEDDDDDDDIESVDLSDDEE